MYLVWLRKRRRFNGFMSVLSGFPRASPLPFNFPPKSDDWLPANREKPKMTKKKVQVITFGALLEAHSTDQHAFIQLILKFLGKKFLEIWLLVRLDKILKTFFYYFFLVNSWINYNYHRSGPLTICYRESFWWHFMISFLTSLLSENKAGFWRVFNFNM